MHRFFVGPDQIDGDYITIEGGDCHHIKKVLRLGIGDEIVICDGQGMDCYCIIAEDNTFIGAKITSKQLAKTELKSQIVLFQGLPKGDKMDLIVQKSVELGVSEIVPVSMKRSIMKINQKNHDKKINRWQDVALSAAKQSRRGIVPEVKSVMSFKEACAYAETMNINLVAYEDAEGISKTKSLMSSIGDYSKIGLFIGPEGGFDKDEITMLELIKSKIMTLGERILRTETAGLSALAIIMFHLEEDQKNGD